MIAHRLRPVKKGERRRVVRTGLLKNPSSLEIGHCRHSGESRNPFSSANGIGHAPSFPTRRYRIQALRGNEVVAAPPSEKSKWIPAFAGMTVNTLDRETFSTSPHPPPVSVIYFGGMIGKRTWEGCSGPMWIVTSPPNTSGGLSAGSLCRNGPTPENTAGMLGSPWVTPPG